MYCLFLVSLNKKEATRGSDYIKVLLYLAKYFFTLYFLVNRYDQEFYTWYWDNLPHVKGLTQDKCIEGMIYVQSTEIEEKFVRFQRVHIQK